MSTNKRLWTIKRFIDVQAQIVTWAAYDLEGNPLPNMHARCEVAKLSEANKVYAMLHGVNQSVGDTAALGQGATLADKFKEMRARIEHLESGSDSWTSTQRAEGDGGLLVQALLRQKSTRDPVKVRAYVRGLGRAKQSALMNSEELREIVAELRAEIGKGTDASELFAELDGLE